MKIKKDSQLILLDFDGTVLTSENYPLIGKDIGAVPVLKKLVENGHKLVLWTRRDGFALDNAVKWFKDNSIELSGVNPKNKSGSPKIDADIFIDDKGLGAPLKFPATGKPYINWTMASAILRKKGFL